MMCGVDMVIYGRFQARDITPPIKPVAEDGMLASQDTRFAINQYYNHFSKVVKKKSAIRVQSLSYRLLAETD